MNRYERLLRRAYRQLRDVRADGGVSTGERYAKSPLTGTWYRVTKWRDKGDGKLQAIEKEAVSEEELPDYIDPEFDGGEP